MKNTKKDSGNLTDACVAHRPIVLKTFYDKMHLNSRNFSVNINCCRDVDEKQFEKY